MSAVREPQLWSSTSERKTCLITREVTLLHLLISDLIVYIPRYFHYVQVLGVVWLCIHRLCKVEDWLHGPSSTCLKPTL